MLRFAFVQQYSLVGAHAREHATRFETPRRGAVVDGRGKGVPPITKSKHLGWGGVQRKRRVFLYIYSSLKHQD